MRRLPDRGAPPDHLKRYGPPAAARAIAAASNGVSKIPFSRAVYASPAVRETLAMLQNGSCAYCEAYIAPVAPGDIEHFRPKGEYINGQTGARVTPGYYWLAYEWTNLLVACPSCNSTWKRTRFPLVDETDRIKNPGRSLTAEGALLINPFEEDPRRSIRFRGAVAYAVNGSVRGQTTIEVIGLNSEPLVDARGEHLRRIAALEQIAVAFADAPEAEEAIILLSELLASDAAYSSCVSDRNRNNT